MSRRRRTASAEHTGGAPRQSHYQYLKNPFPPPEPHSNDHIAAIHEAALSVLEDKGMKVLFDGARNLFRQAGARVNDSTEMVYIGREIIEAALASAPRRVDLYGGAPHRQVRLELGWINFLPGSGAPNCSDALRGRRPGSERDWRELVTLHQHFDVLTMIPPMVEPQDVDPQYRHLAFLDAQLTLSDKVPFTYARGTEQAEQSFELLAEFRALDDASWQSTPSTYTIINTNSPRQIDIPMAEGLIDFARHGQLSIVTPFCLMGAMAPITLSGALVLSHAEALAAIALTQLARAGAPVLYGSFISNVDMKSGSPAFGSAEQIRANFASGQLARLIGLPWRCAAGSSENANDAVAAHQSSAGTWSATLAGCSVLVHSAGWLEGGLVMSYEKLLCDLEMVMMLAEQCQVISEAPDELALETFDEVEPGGHYFGSTHTLSRYRSAFHQPLIADGDNHGAWLERGGLDAHARATERWQALLAEPNTPVLDEARVERLKAVTEHRRPAKT